MIGLVLSLVSSVDSNIDVNKCDEQGVAYKVFFIPLEAQFYTPVTPDNIEKRAFYVFEISSCKISILFDLIKEQKKSKWDDFRGIRIKIVRINDGKSLYISDKKNILNDEFKYFIKQNLVEEIIEEIEDYSSRYKSRYPYNSIH